MKFGTTPGGGGHDPTTFGWVELSIAIPDFVGRPCRRLDEVDNKARGRYGFDITICHDAWAKASIATAAREVHWQTAIRQID